jgi:hypothetical protein
VLREGIIMHIDHSGSTRRFRNPGRIEDFWDQQGKVAHGKEVVEMVVEGVELGLVEQP